MEATLCDCDLDLQDFDLFDFSDVLDDSALFDDNTSSSVGDSSSFTLIESSSQVSTSSSSSPSNVSDSRNSSPFDVYSFTSSSALNPSTLRRREAITRWMRKRERRSFSKKRVISSISAKQRKAIPNRSSKSGRFVKSTTGFVSITDLQGCD